MYVVQSNIATGNLIFNGSFELGVAGFHSEYINNQVSIVNEGTYAVVADAHTVHPDFYCNHDHTTGLGKFMAVNGAGVANVKVWYVTLTSIQPQARYEFSTWITSLHQTNPATLQFSINGQLMNLPFHASPNTCSWQQFFSIWDADTNHQATISIVNQNTILNGNDFALDDISFATVIVYYDTVCVNVLPQFNSSFDTPSSACEQEAVTVAYSGNAPDTANFHWDFDGGTVLSGSGPGPYEIAYPSAGNPFISLWVDGGGCPSDTNFQTVVIGANPSVSVYADNTNLPYGASTILHGSNTGGTGPFEYSWSPPELLVDPGIPDPQTIALEYTTAFILTVTDQATGCTGYDTVVIQVAGGPLGMDLSASPDVIIPYGAYTSLHGTASAGSGNYSYHWEPASLVLNADSDITQTVNLTSTTIFSLIVTDLATGCISESNEVIIQVDGGPLSVIISPDKPHICEGDTVILTAFASGGDQGSYTYTWSDNLGNNYPSTQQIIAFPDNTLEFHVIVNDGFNLVDSYFTLIVNPSAAFSWIGGQDVMNACPYDSVILKPEPSPSAWSYLWSNGSVEDQISIKSTGIGFDIQTYTLTATTADGCEFTRPVTIIFDFSYCSGINEELQEASFRIMPNPNNGKFRILLNDPEDFTEIYLYSPLEGKVFEKNITGKNHEIDIDPGPLPAGLYIIYLQGSPGLVSRKMIILP